VLRTHNEEKIASSVNDAEEWNQILITYKKQKTTQNALKT
jgi:hypothetical protein